MENPRKMVKKLKTMNSNQKSNAFTYKHFNSTNNKRRKNRKKYFEHDTRTRNLRTSVAQQTNVGTTAAIKKIKFNNEINIYEANDLINSETDIMIGQMTKKNKKKKNNNYNNNNNSNNNNNNNNNIAIKCLPKKRSNSTRNRRNNGIAGAVNIQSTTKKLQKQLIETQKNLQKQLNALQEHQREQNNSFLALIHSNCMHGNSGGSAIRTVAASPPSTSTSSSHIDNGIQRNQNAAINLKSNLIAHTKSHTNQSCSDNIYTFLHTDQSKCSIDKMANGNKSTAIRAFTCDSTKRNNYTVSIDPEAKAFTPPKDLCNHHHCNSCMCSIRTTATGDPKKPPKLKSIILSTNNNTNPIAIALNVKQEITASNRKGSFDQCSTPNKIQATDMQFTDTKDTKPIINSYFKSNECVQQNDVQRSYSPPLPATHRLTSTISNVDSHQTGTNHETRAARSSKDRKTSNKKRKKRRRSYSRDTRSKSRSFSRSRSSTRSKSRSRSRSYRRYSTRSRSSSSEYSYARRYSQDRKKKSHSKNSDVFRRSSKRDERHFGCSCNCINYCKKSTKQSQTAKNKSKSPSFDLKQNNISPSDSKRNKRSTTALNDANGSTSKKKPITITSGVLLKQQPIVKLHSSPATESDTENEVDDKFDRKYEELLTFETNEDERREQRLLKALSDIAAKAKQKIQSISDSNVTTKTMIAHADRNHNHERSASKTNKSIKKANDFSKKANDSRDERRTERISEDRHDIDDYSPRERKHTKRESSRRSRRDSSCSSTSSKDEKSQRSSRSPSIPRRRGSPSFLDRRRITSARKKPIPYQRSSPYNSYDECDST